MILGIDEVGRGCLAGPLVVGVVCLNKPISGLADSKKLSKSKRLVLNKLILKNSLIASLGWVWPEEIDKLGLTKSMKLAIKRALIGKDIESYQIVIDGNINYLNHLSNSLCLIKADQSVPEVSAASIIAKVARDKYMIDLSSKYPEYSFVNNVGYGTKEHIKAIIKHGPSIVHRSSFKLSEKTLNNF